MRSLKLSLLVLALAGCRSHTPAAPALPVTAEVVAGTSVTDGSRFSAVVRPAVQIDLAFKVGGYVDGILQVRGVDGRLRPVQDGDVVRRGTVLAAIRAREHADALAQARASAAQARADFDRVSQLYENRSVSQADYDAAYARF